MAFDFKKEYKDLYLPKKKPSIIRVPKMNYLSVCGNGNPNEPDGDYHKSIELLYGIAYTLRMSYKTDHKIDDFFEICSAAFRRVLVAGWNQRYGLH